MTYFPSALRSFTVACAAYLLVALVPPATVAQDDVTDYYEDARAFLSAGDRSSALIQLKNALQNNGQHVPSLLLMGEVLLESGDPAAAEAAISEALLLGADPGSATLMLADAYLAQGLYRRIVTELSPLQLQGAARADLLGYIAMAHRKLGDAAASTKALRQALEIDAGARIASIAQAEASLAAGDAEAALETSARLTERFPGDDRVWELHAAVLLAQGDRSGALDSFTEALTLNERLVSARVARASLHLAGNRPTDAARDIAYVRENFPGDPRGAFFKALMLERSGDGQAAKEMYQLCASILASIDAETIARDQQLTVMAAISSSKTGAAENATQLLAAYQARDPDNLATGSLLADLLLDIGEGAAALTVVRPLLVDAPSSVELKTLQARALSSLGQHREAIAIWSGLEREGKLDLDTSARYAFDELAAGDLPAGIARFESVLAQDRTRIRDLYFLARAQIADGRPKQAVSLARRLVEYEPESVMARELLGRALLEAGELEAAHGATTAALELFPNTVGLKILRAEIAIATGDIDGAGRQLTVLTEEHPSNGSVLLQRARAALAAGNLEEARQWTEEATRADGTRLESWQLLVRLQLELGDGDAALDSSRAATRRLPDRPGAALLYADALARTGDRPRALTEYTRISRRADISHGDLFRIAQAQLRAGAPADASSTLFKARAMKPDSLKYATTHIDTMLRMGDHDAALREAEAIASRFPDKGEPLALVARARIARGERSPAWEYFERALDLETESARLVLTFAAALTEAGETERSAALLSDWLSSHPGDLAVQASYANLLIESRRWEDAARVLESMLGRLPDNPPLLNNLAYAQQRMGSAASLATAQRAYELAPESPNVNDTLGWILVQEQGPDAGLPYLREAVARRANDATLRYHLAVALHELGRDREATEELRTALRLSTDFSEREDATRLLRSLEQQGPQG